MKYKVLTISGCFLINSYIKGQTYHFKCKEGLPEGTKFCYAIPHSIYGIKIVIEHESFPELKDGDEIPEFEPTPLFDSINNIIIKDQDGGAILAIRTFNPLVFRYKEYYHNLESALEELKK